MRSVNGRRAGLALGVLAAALESRVAHADPTELPPPVAFNYGESETPRTAAMGGAQRALGNSTSALFLNPAGMVSTRVYHIEALAQVTPEAQRQVYGGAIADSVTGRLAGGIGVTGGFVDADGLDRSMLDVRLALAYPLTDRVFVGLGGRYSKVAQSGRAGEFGDSPFSGGLQDPAGGRFAFVNTFTFDAGLTLRAADAVFISVLGQNLTYPNHSLLPTTVGGGIGLGTRDFSVEVDGVADFSSFETTTARIMAGGELLLGDHVPIRAGYRYEQGAQLHSLSAGLGYVGREFSIEGAVRRTLSDPGATTIVLSLAYFLESTGLTRAPTPDF